MHQQHRHEQNEETCGVYKQWSLAARRMGVAYLRSRAAALLRRRALDSGNFEKSSSCSSFCCASAAAAAAASVIAVDVDFAWLTPVTGVHCNKQINAQLRNERPQPQRSSTHCSTQNRPPPPPHWLLHHQQHARTHARMHSPKSHMRTVPAAVRSTFSGFRSR